MLRGVIASLDEAAAHPSLHAAACLVLSVATSGGARLATPGALLSELQAAVNDIDGTLAQPREGHVVTARGHSKQCGGGGGSQRRGGSEVVAALRAAAETHWRVKPRLMQARVDQVR